MKPHVITVYGNLIFFASEKHDAILKGDKTNGGTFEFVRNYTGNLLALISIFHNFNEFAQFYNCIM